MLVVRMEAGQARRSTGHSMSVAADRGGGTLGAPDGGSQPVEGAAAPTTPCIEGVETVAWPDSRSQSQAAPLRGSGALAVTLCGLGILGALWLARGGGVHFYAHDYSLTEVLLGLAAVAALVSATAALLARLVGYRPEAASGAQAAPDAERQAEF